MAGGRHTLSAAGIPRRRDRARRRSHLWLLIVCLIMFGALISLFTVRGVRISALRRQYQSSLLSHAEAMAARQDLEAQLALQDDLTAIEDAAREKLGWVMPGEERVLFVGESGNTAGEGE